MPALSQTIRQSKLNAKAVSNPSLRKTGVKFDRVSLPFISLIGSTILVWIRQRTLAFTLLEERQLTYRKCLHWYFLLEQSKKTLLCTNPY